MKKTLLLCAFTLSMCSGVVFAKSHSSHHVHQSATQVAKPININKATKSELVSIKGIGDKKAQAIIQYRQEHGAFNSVDDLTQIKGISSKLLSRIETQQPGMLTISKK